MATRVIVRPDGATIADENLELGVTVVGLDPRYTFPVEVTLFDEAAGQTQTMLFTAIEAELLALALLDASAR